MRKQNSTFSRGPSRENQHPLKTIFLDHIIKNKWAQKIPRHLFSRKSGIDEANRTSTD